MTDTTKLLDKAFKSKWSAAAPITPTLMFAGDSVYRSAGLDDLAAGGKYVRQAGGAMTVDFKPAGAAELLPDTVHSIKWMTYCGQGTGGSLASWRPCSPEQTWAELDRRYGATIAEPGDTPAMVVGRSTFMQLYNLTLAQGVSNVVQSQGKLQITGIPMNDKQVGAALPKGSVTVTKQIIKLGIEKYYAAPKAATESIGWKLQAKKVLQDGRMAVKNKLTETQNKAKDATTAIKAQWAAASNLKRGLVVGATVLVVGAAIFSVLGPVIWPESTGVKIAAVVITAVMTGAAGIIMPMLSAWRLSTTLMTAQVGRGAALLQVLRGAQAVDKVARAMNVVGTVIVIAVAWGFFINSILESGTTFNSPQFNRALAGMIATTIVIVVLAMLASSKGGFIIVAILGLVDIILTVLCGAKVKGACFTITGKVGEFLADVIYSYDLMIEVDTAKGKNPDLVMLGAPEPDPGRSLARLGGGQPHLADDTGDNFDLPPHAREVGLEGRPLLLVLRQGQPEEQHIRPQHDRGQG